MVIFVYLFSFSFIRELIVKGLTAATDKPMPFEPHQALGNILGVNLVVVAGWVFTTYISYVLAIELRKKIFPSSNEFMTIALVPLFASAISYCNEVTGIRLGLWQWEYQSGLPMRWIPFDWPFNAFEGWSATSMMIMFLYICVRERLFVPNIWINLVITSVLFIVYAASDLTVKWFGPESPRMKLTLVYLLAFVFLGLFSRPPLFLKDKS
ncbi:MAG: hypothetical protein N3B13_02900 [Deltaproteobacteria bacterium]|nr:hypothetical protein [Deltaproteobacteria bacterium]